MCIVIDVNAFPSVFNESSADHNDFSYVKDWIRRPNHRAKLVYGGSQYKKELRQMPKYQAIILELDKIRKVCEIDGLAVDRWQRRIDAKYKHKDFDDSHIIAIIAISTCRLICTKDRRSFPFLLNKSFYPRNFKLPKLYTSKRNSDLLNNKNMSNCCNF